MDIEGEDMKKIIKITIILIISIMLILNIPLYSNATGGASSGASEGGDTTTTPSTLEGVIGRSR